MSVHESRSCFLRERLFLFSPGASAAHEPRNRRTLATLREALTLTPDALGALLKDMQATTAAGGLIARHAT